MPKTETMTAGFRETEIAIRSGNGRDDVLVDPLHFVSGDGTTYRVPAGSTTDGMSTPGPLHALPGFEPTGRHWFSAVLHDAAYRGTLEVSHFGKFIPAHLTRKQADDLLGEALATQGVPRIRRAVIHTALRLFGGPNFKANARFQPSAR